MNDFVFYATCVDWPKNDLDTPGGLIDLIDQRRQITRDTLLMHVHPSALRVLEASLGYAVGKMDGLKMKDDWHVEYFKSKLHGEIVYGFRHSAIEYVFRRKK